MAEHGVPEWHVSCNAMEALALLHMFGFYIMFYSGQLHLFNDNTFLGWGSSWEPFLFLHNGFTVAYGHFMESSVEKQSPQLLRQVLSVYPPYLLSVSLKVLQKLVYPSAHPSQGLQASPSWLQLPEDLLLLGSSWNEPTWLLRSILLHLAAWHLTHRLVASFSARKCLCGLIACGLLVFLRVLLWKRGLLPAQPANLLSLVTLPSSIAGWFLARLAVLHPTRPTLTFSVGQKCCGLGGIIALALVILLWLLCASSPRVIFKLGLLLPCHALLTRSLVQEDDLLAQWLRWRPLAWAGQLRHAFLVLQDPACTVLLRHCSRNWQHFHMLRFITIVLPAYVGLSGLISQPAQLLAARALDLFGKSGHRDAAPGAGLPVPQRSSPMDTFAPLEFLAVLHIFGFHLIFYSFRPEFYREQNFLAWGGSWDPLFFVLSGFKLTYVQSLRASSSKSESIGTFMLRRVKRVYPLYVFSLVVKCVQKVVYENPHPTQRPEFNILDWALLPQNLLLWQNRWNGPAWFIRNILIQSFLWKLMCPWLMSLSSVSCWSGFIGSMLVTYVRILVWKLGKPAVDLHLTQHSLANFHMLLCGAFLARLSTARGPRGLLTLSACGHRVALGGLVSLVSLLSILAASSASQERVPVKVGLLLPLHALLVHSATCKDDVLAGWCRWLLAQGEAVRAMSRSAYALAILQDPVITVLMRHWACRWHSFNMQSFLLWILPSYIVLGLAAAQVQERLVTLLAS